jgi:hypothetical protein
MAANIARVNAAWASGAPCEMSAEVNSSSLTTERVICRPVISERIAATSSKVSACAVVRGGVSPSRRPCSVSAIAAASARSACVVQETDLIGRGALQELIDDSASEGAVGAGDDEHGASRKGGSRPPC